MKVKLCTRSRIRINRIQSGYLIDVTYRITESGDTRVLESGDVRILE